MAGNDTRPARPRGRGVLRATLVALAMLLLGAVVLVGWATRNLGAPSIKRRVEALLRDKAGIGLDYASGQVGPGGVHLVGLRLASPPAMAALAPTLASVERIDIDWDLGLGGLKRATARLSGIRVTVVIDENGRTSFDGLGSTSAPGPAEPSPPLSRLLEEHFFRASLPVVEASVEDVAVRVLWTRKGRVERTLDLSGLALSAAVEHGAAGNQGRLSLGSPAGGRTSLRVEEPRSSGAELDWQIGARVEPASGVSLTTRVRLLSQELHPALASLVDRDGALVLGATVAPAPGESRTRVSVDKLELAGGAVAVSARAELPDDASAPISIAQLHLSLAPAAWPMIVPLLGPGLRDSLELESPSVAIDAAEVVLARAFPGAVSTKKLAVSLGAPRLAHRAPGAALDARDLDVRLTVEDAKLDASHLEALSGRVALDTSAGRLDLVTGERRLMAQTLRLGLRSALDGKPPYAADASVSTGRLEARTRGVAEVTVLAPLELSISAMDVVPVAAAPARSAGRAVMKIKAEGLTASASLDHVPSRGELGFDVAVSASALGRLRALVPALDDSLGVRLAPLSVDLASKGVVRGLAGLPGLGSLQVEHETRIGLRGVETTRKPETRLGSATLIARTRGTTTAQSGTISLDGVALQVAGRTLGDAHAALDLDFDLARPRARLTLSSEGAAGPTAKVRFEADWVAASRRLKYAAHVTLGRLGALKAVLAPVLERTLPRGAELGLDGLGIVLDSEGQLDGVLRTLRLVGEPAVVLGPLGQMRGSQSLRLEVTGASLRGARGLEVTVPRVALSTELDGQDTRRRATLRLEVEEAVARWAGNRVRVAGLLPALEIEVKGQGARQVGTLALDVPVGSMDQNLLERYPIRQARLTARMEADQRGVVRIGTIQLDNAAGGTRLELRGGVDTRSSRLGRVLGLEGLAGAVAAAAASGAPAGGPGPDAATAEAADDWLPGRRALALDGRIEQRLGDIGAAIGIKATGAVAMPLRIESGDLRLVHLWSALELDAVGLKSEARDLEVSGVQGKLPVALDFLLDGARGPRLLEARELEAYPRVRYSDHQPFLRGQSYFAAQRIRVGAIEMGPLAGNARVDHTSFLLDQLEMSLRGGRVTGSCRVELRGADSVVEFRGAVTGLTPSGKTGDSERLDANAALAFQPYRQTLEGRAELVRISRRHLLRLLDYWDPYHAELSANRARLALKIGYPESVRMRFEDGFAGLQIKLGGLARIAQIQEVRAVPVGPLLGRFLGPWLPRQEETQP